MFVQVLCIVPHVARIGKLFRRMLNAYPSRPRVAYLTYLVVSGSTQIKVLR